MPPEPYRTRFAPSPTGFLHLGHAFSALTAWHRARAARGIFLLRMEDIDTPRCRPEFETAIYEDLHWLGLRWPAPVLRQSDRMPAYRQAVDRLVSMGLCYPCSCTRAEIRAALSAPQEGARQDPKSVAVYPGTCRGRSMAQAGPTDAIRLDMARALEQAAWRLSGFQETGPDMAGWHAVVAEDLIRDTGDVVLARRDIGTSYHLSVVVDDAAQNITEVVRGSDLFGVTSVQVLLQTLLELPTPTYYHHKLVRDSKSRRLAKRDDARAIRHYRDRGDTPADIARRVGLGRATDSGA